MKKTVNLCGWLALMLVIACSCYSDTSDDDDDEDDGANTPSPIGDEDLTEPPDTDEFYLESSAYDYGGDIPTRFLCENRDGENLSAPLSWRNAPDATTAFALTLLDLDCPDGNVCVHWAVLNLPANSTSLAEGAADSLPNGAWETLAYNGEIGYQGPCAPAGESHRYVYYLHALGEEIVQPDGAAELADIQAELNAATLAKTYLLGYFHSAQ